MMVFLGQIPPLNLIMGLGELVDSYEARITSLGQSWWRLISPDKTPPYIGTSKKIWATLPELPKTLKKKEIHNIIHKGYLKEFQRRSVQKFASDLSTSDYQPVVNKEAFCLDQYVQKEQSIYRRSVFEGRKITARNITPENSCSIRWTWFPLGKICQSSSPTKIVKVCHAYTKMPWS